MSATLFRPSQTLMDIFWQNTVTLPDEDNEYDEDNETLTNLDLQIALGELIEGYFGNLICRATYLGQTKMTITDNGIFHTNIQIELSDRLGLQTEVTQNLFELLAQELLIFVKETPQTRRPWGTMTVSSNELQLCSN